MNEKITAKGKQLNAMAARADGLQKRYTAHLMLYDAACTAMNESEISQRRDECHTMLDAILDNTREVAVCAKELQELMYGQ